MSEYHLAPIRMEGAPVHPDDTDADLTDEQRAVQLLAHANAVGLQPDEISQYDRHLLNRKPRPGG